MRDDNWYFLYWDEPTFKKKEEKESEDNEEKEVD
jgi:hypothetical protein